jgi:hypothetical protein
MSKVSGGKGGGKADQANASFLYSSDVVERVFSHAVEFIGDRFPKLVIY